MIFDRPLEGVVLDIDGTLISLSKGVGEIYSELLAEHGVIANPDHLNDVTRRVWTAFQPEYLNSNDQNRTTHEREKSAWLSFVRQVLHQAGLPCSHDTQLIESIYNAFATSRFRRVEPGVESFLRAVQRAGLRTYAATNNDVRSRAVLEAMGLKDLFRAVYVAGDIGWKKPSQNYYRVLREQIGVPAEKLLHIGNDPHLDVRVPIECGWHAALYDAKSCGPEPHFVSFDELCESIESRRES